MPLNCLLVDDSEAFLASAARLLSAEGIAHHGLCHLRRHAIRLLRVLARHRLVDISWGARRA